MKTEKRKPLMWRHDDGEGGKLLQQRKSARSGENDIEQSIMKKGGIRKISENKTSALVCIESEESI